MERIIDLSHELTDGMPFYPEDGPLHIHRTKDFKKDGYTNHHIEADMHTGTHLDGPMHMTDSNDYISNIPVDTFVDNGKLIDVRDESSISYKDEYNDHISENDIVLFHTGWDRHFGKSEYYLDYPVMDEEFAAFLINRKVKMVGFDTPSPDKEPYPVHKALLTNSICIIENLTNLNVLIDCSGFEVMAFPLKIKTDSSFVRVVAKVIN